jgi:hypothetical protein
MSSESWPSRIPPWESPRRDYRGSAHCMCQHRWLKWAEGLAVDCPFATPELQQQAAVLASAAQVTDAPATGKPTQCA